MKRLTFACAASHRPSEENLPPSVKALLSSIAQRYTRRRRCLATSCGAAMENMLSSFPTGDARERADNDR